MEELARLGDAHRGGGRQRRLVVAPIRPCVGAARGGGPSRMRCGANETQGVPQTHWWGSGLGLM